MAAADFAFDLPKLEKYELLEEIGHGGMATVYRGRDRRLGREVAVKIIHRHLRDNGEVATRFIAEARAAASLKHRGIVEVYDVSSEEDREKYLVAELVRGVTLRKLLVDHRDMPAEIGAAIVLEVCDAIQHAHESGIVHRDVKPENVLVELPCHRDLAASGRNRSDPVSAVEEATPGLGEEDSHDGADSSRNAIAQATASRREGGVIVKITDFGIAKVLDAQGVTSTGQVLGSPAHMAPEQIEGGDIDVRTDVFALGVLLYEALVGHLPFEGKNPAQVLRRVLEGEFAPVDVERGDVGTRWARIVHAALALAPGDRTATPAALADQIRDELRGLGIGEPHQELVAYFEAPEAYREQLRPRLVKRLLVRGERAKRKRDVPGAAADFNRALALAPQDAEVQRRVLEMSRGRGRMVMLRRAGMALGGSVALGLVAFGIVRATRVERTALPTIPTASAAAEEPDLSLLDDLVDPSLDENDVDRPYVIRPVGPPASARRVVQGPVRRVETAPRAVKLLGAPAGAKVLVDGAPYAWNSVQMLAPGTHPVVVGSGPGENCCEEVSQSITVPAAAKGEEKDAVAIPLVVRFKPATVSLAGAPPEGRLVCGIFGLNLSAGATGQVKMQRTTENDVCSAISSAAEVKITVSVAAGRSHTVRWP